METIVQLLLVGFLAWAAFFLVRKKREADEAQEKRLHVQMHAGRRLREREDFQHALVLLEKAAAARIPEGGLDLKSWVADAAGPEKELSYTDMTRLKVTLLARIRRVVVAKHSAVLLRKRNQTVYKDDYGHFIFDRWFAERAYFIERVLVPEMRVAWRGLGEEPDGDVAYWFHGSRDSESAEHDEWTNCIEEALDEEEEKILAAESEAFDESMSGDQYERFVGNLISEAGWECTYTPSTADHGADIIAVCHGVRIAVQCKKYVGKVGNDAVQAVSSGAKFYDCESACVVTNSEYTAAAKVAANKIGVELLHHDDVASFFLEMSEEIEGRVFGADEPIGPSVQGAYRGLDPYALLQIARNASPEEIQSAYRRLVPQYHPDRVATMGKELQLEAEKWMAKLNWAREECLKRVNATAGPER